MARIILSFLVFMRVGPELVDLVVEAVGLLKRHIWSTMTISQLGDIAYIFLVDFFMHRDMEHPW